MWSGLGDSANAFPKVGRDLAEDRQLVFIWLVATVLPSSGPEAINLAWTELNSLIFAILFKQVVTTQFIFKEALSDMIDNCLSNIDCETKQRKWKKRALLTHPFSHLVFEMIARYCVDYLKRVKTLSQHFWFFWGEEYIIGVSTFIAQICGECQESRHWDTQINISSSGEKRYLNRNFKIV